MAYEGYQHLRIARDGRIVTATIDNPPINLITLELFGELARLSQELGRRPRRAGLRSEERQSGFLPRPLRRRRDPVFPSTGRPRARRPAPTPITPCANASARWTRRPSPRSRAGSAAAERAGDVVRHALRRDRQDHRQPDGGPAGHPAGGTGTQRMPRLVGRGTRARGDPRRHRPRRRNGGTLGLSQPRASAGDRDRPLCRRSSPAASRRSRSRQCGSPSSRSTRRDRRSPRDSPRRATSSSS